jgi:hypothetical protein
MVTLASRAARAMADFSKSCISDQQGKGSPSFVLMQISCGSPLCKYLFILGIPSLIGTPLQRLLEMLGCTRAAPAAAERVVAIKMHEAPVDSFAQGGW